MPEIKCKCGCTIGCFVDGDKYRCPECVIKERDAWRSACNLMYNVIRFDGIKGIC